MTERKADMSTAATALYAELHSAGLRVNESMWHVFEFYPVPEARRSMREVADFMKAH